jgi:hypothetical protein
LRTAQSLESGSQDRSQWSGSLLISFTEPRIALGEREVVFLT